MEKREEIFGWGEPAFYNLVTDSLKARLKNRTQKTAG